tara:strand:- start:1247 stop:1882 length:636 start_codon:yes stop_codon:yes gene_type:complete
MYKILILIFFFFINSCTLNQNVYEIKGFVKINNEKQISVRNIKKNKLIKIINISNSMSIKVKTNSENKLIPNRIGNLNTDIINKLKISKEFPLVIIEEAVINKNFIAKKSKIYNEEKNVANQVSSEKITFEKLNNKKSNKYIYLEYGPFSGAKYANLLINNLKKKISNEKIIFEPKKHDNRVLIGPIYSLKEFDKFAIKLNKLNGYNIILK